MRTKQKKCIITYYTTAAAIAMEKTCKRREISGRLIPVPPQITADCGLAWMAPLTEREKLELLMKEEKILSAGIYELELLLPVSREGN